MIHMTLLVAVQGACMGIGCSNAQLFTIVARPLASKLKSKLNKQLKL